MLGKHAKATLPSSKHKSKEILDLVHLDVCGLISIASILGGKYYVSLIDDVSPKTWIYFLKTKDKVFSRFQEFKGLVENQIGKKIKVLRLDNGGEYTSNDFKYLWKNARIKGELIVAYNP